MKFPTLFFAALTILMPSYAMAADATLNKDQFKAPAAGDTVKKGSMTSGAPVGSVPVPKDTPREIQGLQSTALLNAYLAAPEPIPATLRGKNERGYDEYVCPRGYYCPGGSETTPAVCRKDRFLWDHQERGTCVRGGGFLYGGRDRTESAPV